MTTATYQCDTCGVVKGWSGAGILPEHCRDCQRGRGGAPTVRELTRQEFAPAGLCAQSDPDLFTPDGQGDHRTQVAKAICRRCPVVDECLEWALENEEGNSVYGGTTARERQVIRRKRRQEVAA